MILQGQINRYTCLATCIGCIINTPVDTIFEWCGHDGSKELAFNNMHRGHHLFELTNVLRDHGFATTIYPKKFIWDTGYSEESKYCKEEGNYPCIAILDQSASYDHAVVLISDKEYFDPSTELIIDRNKELSYYMLITIDPIKSNHEN